MNYENYDYNVYSDKPNHLYLTAYEWELSPDGDLQMNSANYHTIEFEYPQHQSTIEFLLDDLWLNQHPFTDYDEWRDLEDVYNAQSPQAVKDFIDNLPAYEMKDNNNG